MWPSAPLILLVTYGAILYCIVSNGTIANDLEWPWRWLSVFESFLSHIPREIHRALSSIYFYYNLLLSLTPMTKVILTLVIKRATQNALHSLTDDRSDKIHARVINNTITVEDRFCLAIARPIVVVGRIRHPLIEIIIYDKCRIHCNDWKHTLNWWLFCLPEVMHQTFSKSSMSFYCKLEEDNKSVKAHAGKAFCVWWL